MKTQEIPLPAIGSRVKLCPKTLTGFSAKKERWSATTTAATPPTTAPAGALCSGDWVGAAREVLSCSRTDWLIITNSPLTGPVLARKLREAETRGTVEIDEQGRDVVLITFTPNTTVSRDAGADGAPKPPST